MRDTLILGMEEWVEEEIRWALNNWGCWILSPLSQINLMSQVAGWLEVPQGPIESPKFRRCSRLSLDCSIFNPGLIWTPVTISNLERQREKERRCCKHRHTPGSTTRAILSLRCRPSWLYHPFSWKCPGLSSTSCNGAPRTLTAFASVPRPTHSHLYGDGMSLREWGKARKRRLGFPRQMLQCYSRPSCSPSIHRDK